MLKKLTEVSFEFLVDFLCILCQPKSSKNKESGLLNLKAKSHPVAHKNHKQETVE